MTESDVTTSLIIALIPVASFSAHSMGSLQISANCYCGSVEIA